MNDLVGFEFDNTFLKLLFMIMINQKMDILDIQNNFKKLSEKIKTHSLPSNEIDMRIKNQLLSCLNMVNGLKTQ